MNIFLRIIKQLLRHFYIFLAKPILRPFAKRIKRYLISDKEYTNPLTDYNYWLRINGTLSDLDRQEIIQRIQVLVFKPLISLITLTYNTREEHLRSLLESVQKQLYPNWELCIVDQGSTAPHVRSLLTKYQALDSRIKVIFDNGKGPKAVVLNNAVDLSEGEYMAILGDQDELSEHALYLVAEEVNQHPKADLIYSDEDQIDEKGERCNPYFKPDWNPDLFYSKNYISHLCILRLSLFKKANKFIPDFEGCEEYDLLLRMIEETSSENIRHIPFVLYHSRLIPDIPSRKSKKTIEDVNAACKVIKAHLRKKNVFAEVFSTADALGCHRVIYPVPKSLPLVSIIILTKDKVGLLKSCLESILQNTDYKNIEVIIVDNQSKEQDTHDYLNNISNDSRVSVLKYDKPFNFSTINNMAAKEAKGELIGLLNNDVVVISTGWLREMVSLALRPEIGIVGAKLYYPNDTIQHAGMILGIKNHAIHILRHLPREHPGYFNSSRLIQNFSVVTGACMVMRREVFEEVNGLDEKLVALCNDVDLCLRVKELGYRIIWTPYAELYHFESSTLLSGNNSGLSRRFDEDTRLMRERWRETMLSDPYYNPNLTDQFDDYSLAPQPRVRPPWKFPEKVYERKGA